MELGNIEAVNTSSELVHAPLKAVIDIGSNSVRLAVWSAPYINRASILKREAFPGLGQYQVGTMMLDKDRQQDAIQILSDYKNVLDNMPSAGFLGKKDIYCFATAAVRQADNRHAFVKSVYEETGLDIHIISGKQEAFYVGLGMGHKFPHKDMLCLDLGGGSLEIAEVIAGQVVETHSVPIGTLRLAAFEKPEAQITEILEPFKTLFLRQRHSVALMGGTWKELVAAYRLNAIHGKDISTPKYLKAREVLNYSQHLEIFPDKLQYMLPNHAQHVPSANVLFKVLISQFGVEDIFAARSNIRYGCLVAMLSDPESLTAMQKCAGL